MANKLLSILRKISEIIAESEDCGAALAKIVQTLAKSLNAGVCSVYIYNPKADELVLAATCGLNADCVGNIRMSAGHGLTGRSFKSREILNISDPVKHPDFIYFEGSGEEIYKSFLSVPLTIGGRCVGVLTLQRESEEKFPPAMIDMARALSAQLGNLLLNAQILESLASEGQAEAMEGAAAAEPGAQAQTARDDKPLLLRGVAASGGVARGKCFLFKPRDVFEEVVDGKCSDVNAEMALFDSAVKLAKDKTLELSKRALTMISEADASIFHAHLLFLDDKSLLDEMRKSIFVNHANADFAVKGVFLEYQKRFMKLGQQIFRDKEMDLKDVMRRIIESIHELRGASVLGEAPSLSQSDLILVAEELLPSDLIRLPTDRIGGIVCGKGGATAHVAALAKALDIPALMGVKGVSEKVRQGEEIVIDCHAELLHIRPSAQVVEHFEEMLREAEAAEPKPEDLAPAKTSDGVHVAVRATISLICETSLISSCGAEGVGLYRTEFFFMIRDYLPTEEEQMKIYSKILKEAGTNDVTIRALDIGADKSLSYMNLQKEDNPALGLRGVRLLLSMKDILKTQLRAILRAGAGAGSRMKLLFPMVASSQEILEVKAVLDEVENELRNENLKHCGSYRFGIMLELPSALLELDSILDLVDYVSVGSNDLLQYVFAVDRCNESVAEMYTNMHPAFLKILSGIGNCFERHPGKTLAVCGEMAASPLAIPLLLGAGFKDMSVAPRRIPSIKRVLRAFTVEECKRILEESIKFSDADAVKQLVRARMLEKGLPAGS